jgi:hypothetical protein
MADKAFEVFEVSGLKEGYQQPGRNQQQQDVSTAAGVDD